jgi:hypothetical protein
MTDRHSVVTGVRMTGQDRAIALRLGNGNMSDGVRLALRFTAKESLIATPLSAILRSAAYRAQVLEYQLKNHD